MKPAPFEYLRAGTLEGVCQLLTQYGSDARLIAGGQSLVPMMAMRLIRPGWLIDINDVESMKFIAVEPETVRIGAATRQASLEAHEGLAGALPLVRQALRWVGHQQTRNRGTFGGSLAHADPSAELPLVAVMLDATLIVASEGAGTREIKAGRFFTGPMSTLLNGEDCLAEIRLPVWKNARLGCGFEEVSVRHGDFALVAACAQVGLDVRGQCSRAALAVGGAGPVPIDLSRHAAGLIGSSLEDAALEHVAHQAVQQLEPPSDLHASAEYRRHLARVIALRALRAARGQARSVAKD